jgi:hypothetical protein
MQERWLTIGEASELTGKSTAAVRMWIKRRTQKGDHVRVKKERGKHCESWMIHSSEMNDLGERVRVESSGEHMPELMNTISLDRYEAMRKELENEREQALQGLMMYRYKFEEIEQKMRLLPAPPEMVARELEEKAAALAQAEKILEEAKETQRHYQEAMEQLRSKLQEEEHAREAYRIQWESAQAELSRPWWRKIWKKR